ncbi:hypothetical protein chiPu_0014208 [Chiloscyllium punctatum]|uniref:Uncharacterized protein n=1 Tax=Chiloscyllium punctatum TaxID=137246 RepID=A0A401SZA6_CHIPU|nr:hypothetical protein [Chiloscyllium punctatum]
MRIDFLRKNAFGYRDSKVFDLHHTKIFYEDFAATVKLDCLPEKETQFTKINLSTMDFGLHSESHSNIHSTIAQNISWPGVIDAE